MFQQMKKRIKNEKGLTLIELLAVIVILAIISAIAIPAIGNIIQNSRDKAVLSEAANLLSGAKIAITDNACGAPATGTGVVTCDATELLSFFDGTLDASDQVVFTPADPTTTPVTKASYAITFKKFETIKDTTRFAEGLSGAVMSDANLTKNLGK